MLGHLRPLFAALAFGACAGAQLPEAPKAQSSDIIPEPCAARALRQRTMSAEQMKAAESQYIIAVIPNFNTVFGDCAPKLSPREKWALVYHSAVAPFTIGMDGLLAGLDEVDGSHNGYGWGPSGYFKRFGAEYADTVNAAVIGNGLLPVVLHQDPRYFQMGAGHPFRKRFLHAAASDIICLSDDGKRQFNTSNVVGNLLSGAISNAYYPANERGVGLTFQNYLTVSLEGSFGSQMLEFAPDITAFFKRRLHLNPAP